MKILSLPLGTSTGIVGIYLLFPIGLRVCLPRIQDYSSGGLQILGKLSSFYYCLLVFAWVIFNLWWGNWFWFSNQLGLPFGSVNNLSRQTFNAMCIDGWIGFWSHRNWRCLNWCLTVLLESSDWLGSSICNKQLRHIFLWLVSRLIFCCFDNWIYSRLLYFCWTRSFRFCCWFWLNLFVELALLHRL